MRRQADLPIPSHLARSIQQTPQTVFGELAQLGERLVCNQEVTGSSPVFSTWIASSFRLPASSWRKREAGKVGGKLAAKRRSEWLAAESWQLESFEFFYN